MCLWINMIQEVHSLILLNSLIRQRMLQEHGLRVCPYHQRHLYISLVRLLQAILMVQVLIHQAMWDIRLLLIFLMKVTMISGSTLLSILIHMQVNVLLIHLLLHMEMEQEWFQEQQLFHFILLRVVTESSQNQNLTVRQEQRIYSHQEVLQLILLNY